jgi:hypothetical protein
MGVLAVYHPPGICHVGDESDSLGSAHEAAVENQPRHSKRDWTRRAIVRSSAWASAAGSLHHPGVTQSKVDPASMTA